MRYLYVLAPDVRVDDVGILWALVLRIVHVVHLIVRLWLALAYLLTARESCQVGQKFKHVRPSFCGRKVAVKIATENSCRPSPRQSLVLTHVGDVGV